MRSLHEDISHLTDDQVKERLSELENRALSEQCKYLIEQTSNNVYANELLYLDLTKGQTLTSIDNRVQLYSYLLMIISEGCKDER